MDAKTVRQEVTSFRLMSSPERAIEDCFPAWYLGQAFGIGPVAALAQTSDPGLVGDTKGDMGLDGFHFHRVGDDLHLCLVQAKYSDSSSQIARGCKDLERCLRPVANVLADTPCTGIENKVYAYLRSAIKSISKDGIIPGLKTFELRIVHLSDVDAMILRANCRKAIEDIKDEFRNVFPEAQCSIELVGPSAISGAEIVTPPTDWFDLHFSATPLQLPLQDRFVTMYSGFGKLSDLVQLYNLRRDELFAHNVRYFLRSRKNVEKGPSGKMLETLREICLDGGSSIPAELFAFFHNGVTIFAPDVRPGSDGVMQVREPFVLNGCQTIKTGFGFVTDQRLKSRIDQAKWGEVSVPLRVITTRDDALIRQITVNNNRQNQISASALRANDPGQVQLAERFQQRGIYYERQEGAFQELQEARGPETIRATYPNTNDGYIGIEDLARSIAASAGELDFAISPSHIFESDVAYARCFNGRRVNSIIFLTFLENVHYVLPTVLKKDLGLEASPAGLRPGRLTYYALCLLIRHVAKNQMSDLVIEYGRELWGKSLAIRQEVGKLLDNRHSRIRGALTEKFMSLDDTGNESLKEAFRGAASSLYLKDNVDAFSVFSRLDATVEA